MKILPLQLSELKKCFILFQFTFILFYFISVHVYFILSDMVMVLMVLYRFSFS